MQLNEILCFFYLFEIYTLNYVENIVSNIVREQLGGNRKDTEVKHDMFREDEIN